MSNSEGVRRLSLAAGLVPAVPLAAILLYVAFQKSNLVVGDIFLGFVAVAITYLVPWGAVRVVAWIVAGFRSRD